MEVLDLEYGLRAIGSGGFVLNPEELMGLQAGLLQLRSKERYKSIYFWGKILGQDADYYIAYGLTNSDFEFPSKVFYFASHDYQFQLLERLTEDIADRVIALGIESPFTGKPADPLQSPAPAADSETTQEQSLTLLEVHRLSQVVQEIDFDTAVVPAGAYSLSEAQQVLPNSGFRGLALEAALTLENYVHFRAPTSIQALKAIARTDEQFYLNFLDPLQRDLPKSSWVFRQDPFGSVVSLRSLCWPGYIAYHSPNSKKFGGCYCGYAQKRHDLPFIL